jgi:hypothetical protein
MRDDLPTVASKSPAREPLLRIAKRQGARRFTAIARGDLGEDPRLAKGAIPPFEVRRGPATASPDRVGRHPNERRFAVPRCPFRAPSAARRWLLRGASATLEKVTLFREVGGLRSALVALLGQHRSHGSRVDATMRSMRAPESSSIRSVAQCGASRSVRIPARANARKTSDHSRSRESSQARVAVVAEFFTGNREDYASVGGGIWLAVTPRGAGATQGAYRLNEETA